MDPRLTLFDAAPHPLWAFDPATLRVVSANPAAARLYGYSPAEFRRLTVRDLDPAGDGCPPVGRHAFRHRDGRPVHAEVSDAGGLRLVASEGPAEAELRLRDRAMEAVAQGIVIADPTRPDSPIVYASPGFERITGYPAAEAVGRNCRFLQGPGTDPQAVERVRAGVRSGEPFTVELLNYRKDGTPFWNELAVSPVRDAGGRLTHLVGVQADVSARKEGEAAAARLAAIVTGSDDAILSLGPDGRVTTWNAGAERLYGYPAGEIVGKHYAVLTPADKADEAAAALARVWRGEAVPAFPTERVHQTGRRVDVSVSVSPIRDRAGRVVGASKIAHDTTAVRRLQEQYLQAQKMDAVGRLAGGLAHDFNNLLTVITGYAQLVTEALPADHPATPLVGEMARAGERAAALTGQLLAFSRRAILEPRTLDVNARLLDLGRMLRRLIGEDVELVFDPGRDVWPVRADPGQFEQAVVNLCVNARDAMPAGGRLTLATRNARAGDPDAPADLPPGEYVRLTAADTGHGMPPEVLARVFDPFFTTKPAGEGSGLGLAMVFGFAAQSGGRVAASSRPGGGTTLSLFLPRAAAPAPVPAAAPAPAALPRGTETVLLVEDAAGVRALARRVLAGCGYAVLAAADGPAAVAAADAHLGPVHLLLTDVVMPGGMNGRQVAEAVVARHPGVRVLYTSGYTADAVLRHGVEQAGTRFLPKPFTPPGLAQKVREVLDARDG